MHLRDDAVSSIAIRQLIEFDRAALEGHLLVLREDRRLRFVALLADSGLRGYVERIDG